MKRLFAGTLLTGAVALMSGCATDGAAGIGASTTPGYDARFGDSVRQARALQTINPEAGRHGDPITGIDGRAGVSAFERYQESFKSPTRTFEVLNIGGSSGGGGQ